MKFFRRTVLPLLFCVAALIAYRYLPSTSTDAAIEPIPAYAGSPYVEVNDNQPAFNASSPKAYETYAPLDLLGRCGAAEACIGPELMPTEEREGIGQVKPTGWHTVRYDDLIEDKYLYNRCHLIGFQLTGENANEQNLITGTRYMNTVGMLPFENQVADYIHKTGNHVLYRVTPDFQGSELVARGVRMEALSVEDSGEGVRFHVYIYNVQPGITIDYLTGESRRTEEPTPPVEPPAETPAVPEETPLEPPTADYTYILNVRSMKFHDPSCSGAADIKEANRQNYSGTREELLAQGYAPCGQCKP